MCSNLSTSSVRVTLTEEDFFSVASSEECDGSVEVLLKSGGFFKKPHAGELAINSVPPCPAPSLSRVHTRLWELCHSGDRPPSSPLLLFFPFTLHLFIYSPHSPPPIPPLPLQSAGVPSCLKDPASSLWSFHSTFCSLLFPKY